MNAQQWAERIRKGAEEAGRKYAHLSDAEFEALGARRQISRPVYEYLHAVRLGRARGESA